MNNEDMSEILQKLMKMVNTSEDNKTDATMSTNANEDSHDISSVLNHLDKEKVSHILQQLNSATTFQNSQEEKNSPFSFDMDTLLKMKTVIDKLNHPKNDPRSNLLLALKPYLNKHRQDNLDKYIQFLSMGDLLQFLDNTTGASH